MNERYENIRKKVIKYFWTTVTLIIALFTIVVCIRTIGDMIDINRRQRIQQERIDKLEAQIKRDSTFIKQLTTSDEFLERYAREQYHMQRPGETVYILEG